jgi:hypothetical protein
MLNNDNMASRAKGLSKQQKDSSSAVWSEKSGVSQYNPCVALPITGWHPLFDTGTQREASAVIESGKILLFPSLSFTLTHDEESFLRSDCVSVGTKSVRFSHDKQRVQGMADKEDDMLTLEALLKRYAMAARDLVTRLFPGYAPDMVMGNTVFRPVEVKPHARHLRDNLHIDTVASEPAKGMRRLRVVTNIHPSGQPRVMRIGETFESLVTRFLPRLSSPLPGMALLLRLLGMTRRLRTSYDHYMLQLQTLMKRDAWYQAEVPQATVSFSAGSSWIMFSDQVSYAEVSGQYVIEQTFMVPADAQDDPSLSPLHILQKLMHRKLA